MARSNASSTFSPDLALASTKSRPSSFAQSSASSVDTSRLRFGAADAVVEDVSSAHRSTLFPTRMQVRCGSACSRTSCNHERALTKPVGHGGEYRVLPVHGGTRG